MNNTILYLIGPPDLPRRAVADRIAAVTGARIIDADDIYRPLFTLIEHGHGDMPDGIWDQVDAVRGAILTTIETMSPRDWSFVFIHAGFDIPPDVAVYRRVRETARQRDARFVPVRLLGSKSKRPLLTFDEADAFDIDLGAAPPEAVAAAILERAG
jgi:hypothetical protein